MNVPLRSLLALSLAACVTTGPEATDDDALGGSLAATTWDFHASEITGGGLANQVAIDPANPAAAALGGDSWGLYRTDTRGDAWYGAMKAGGTAATAYTGDIGQYYNSGLAYSRANPGVVYSLVGRVDGTAVGGFLAVTGNTVLRYVPSSATSPSGAEPTWNRHHHPRPKGKLVVDFDSATGTESIYAGGGAGTGVFRSRDGGATWTSIALATLPATEFITGMSTDPGTGNLVVTTKGLPDAAEVSVGHAYIVTAPRTRTAATAVIPVDLHGLQLESITRFGGALWAAARTHGIVKSTDGGATFTPVFAANGDDMTAIGGLNTLIVAACTSANTGGATRDCVYRSTTGGASWDTPFSAPLDTREWGTGQTWWHAADSNPAGRSYVANDVAITRDGTVYLAGRAGVWISRDSGATFRPGVYGVNGTMHTRLGVSGGNVMVDDVDFGCESTPASAHFDDASLIKNLPAASCTLSPTGTLSARGGGHTIFVTAPTAAGAPSHFYVDCAGNQLANCTATNDAASSWFQGTVIKPTDVAYAAGHFYIAQFGGGVVIATPPAP